MDAESVMGMISAANQKAPSATMHYLSCKIRSQMSEMMQFVDGLADGDRDAIINFANKEGRKVTVAKRRKQVKIDEEIAKRISDKIQK
jgi:hypothetical protein